MMDHLIFFWFVVHPICDGGHSVTSAVCYLLQTSGDTPSLGDYGVHIWLYPFSRVIDLAMRYLALVYMRVAIRSLAAPRQE